MNAFNNLSEAEDNILIYNLKRRCNNLLFYGRKCVKKTTV